jgi:hypothetical protein
MITFRNSIYPILDTRALNEGMWAKINISTSERSAYIWQPLVSGCAEKPSAPAIEVVKPALDLSWLNYAALFIHDPSTRVYWHRPAVKPARVDYLFTPAMLGAAA